MLNVTIDTKELTRLADRAALLTEKNLRYAVAQAMTDSAKDAQARLKAETPRFVDRPTPWTENSTYVRPAGPNRLTIEVGFKQDAVKGTAAGEYLNPMARGGDRSSTRVEGVLRSGGVIKRDQFIVPTPAFRGDPFGNVPKGTYTMMLSQIKAFSGPLGYLNASGARSKRKRATAGQFFTIRSRELGEGPKGIFYRAPGERSFELAFGVLNDAPNYERRFPIQRILNDEYAKAYARNIQTSLARELERALGR
jgi:hypothetical protein